VAESGFRVDRAALQDRMKALGPGGVLALTVFRRDELRTVGVTLAEPPVEVAWLEPVPDPTPAQQAAFQAWTGAALP
jgi:predicted metalloprotease with PDZ domain